MRRPDARPTGCPRLDGYDPLSASELRDPYASFARARANAPVFFSDVLHTRDRGVWCISRHDDVLRALREPEVFSSNGQLPRTPPPPEVADRMPAYPWSTTVLQLDDPEHKAARAILQAPFTPASVRAREGFLVGVAERLADGLTVRQGMEFIEDFAFPLSLTTIAEIVGVAPERFDELTDWVTASFNLLSGRVTGHDEIVASATTVVGLNEYLVELIEDRRVNPRDDYTSMMVHTAHEDGSHEPTGEMVHHIFTLLSAGFETTALSMGLGLRSLLAHREQWEMLLADRSLVPGAVEEMLRHRTLVKRLFRTTTRDVEVSGVTIPRGPLVALLVPSAHRDDTRYADADRFDIGRPKNVHLAFGKGKHFCVGAPLARLEFTVMLRTFLDRFPTLRLVDPDGVDEQWGPDLRFDALRALPVAWSD